MTSIEQETRARAPLRVARDRGETVELDILIVGAGPVGLFLANECAAGAFVAARRGALVAIAAFQSVGDLSSDARDFRHGRNRRALP